MKVLLEMFLFLGIFFPLYHFFNVILNLKKKTILTKNSTRSFSILIPCYNEEKIIKNTIEGILRLDYSNYECIFINDGSKDNTLRTLKKVLKLKKIIRLKTNNLDSKNIKAFYKSKRHPRFFVIDKGNGGKSDALNIGINYASYDHVVTLDADSVLKRDALLYVSNAFDDDNVVAASGIIQIMQAYDFRKDKTTLKIKPLLKLQAIEYIKSCYCYKASLAKLESLLVVSGAFGVFRKDILIAINGFNHCIGEDLDLTLKIQFRIENTKKKIAYVPEAICYTEGPETFKDFIKQRKRWQKSFIESLFNFKSFIFKNAFTKTLPFFIIVDALFIGVISSFIIVLFSSLFINNLINHTLSHIVIYLLIFVAIHLLYNIGGLSIAYYYGIRFKGWDFFRMIFTVILDILVYRAVILYTIIIGTITYFTEKKEWNKVSRSGRNYHILRREC